jgi:MYXO-CTERM domain-containing protein
LRNALLFALAVLVPGFAASAQDAGVIWKGDFENGTSSLTGNCSSGQNQWCHLDEARAAQITVVQDPVVQGKYAARFEVKYGDVVSGESDSRALMTGPTTLWEDEGTERWYRWQSMWPEDYVGQYPKWDQLSDYPSIYSNAGSVVEWHHDANGAVETGSAPLYIGANNNNIWMCIVDQATSECKETINLASLIRGHWHDIVLHAKWSSDPTIGFLDIWVDGVHVLPMHYTSNKYPGMRNYLIVGLYRNGEIGDPSLTYANGNNVYASGGTPGVVYLDGFIVGSSQAAVLSETMNGDTVAPADAGTPVADAGTVAPPPVVTTPDAGTVAAAEADAGTASASPVSTTATAPDVAAASLTGASGGGCSTGGAPVAWFAVFAGAFFFWRKRRT